MGKNNFLKELTNLKMGSISVDFDDNTKITAEEIDNIIHFTISQPHNHIFDVAS